MKNVTLKQLKYFEAVAQHGHFGRAADACAISQPALSLQIREMEDQLGAPLFERGPRLARLTPLGQAFAPRVREILRAVEELGTLALSLRGPLTGQLRLGVIPTIAPYLLPVTIKTIAHHYPQLDLRPREAVTQRLVEDLADGRLDLALVALPVSEPSLMEYPLFDEDFVLVRPAGDANLPVPRPENLPQMRLLLLEEGHCFREQALSFCKIGPNPPRDLMEGSSLSTLVQMVGAGIGVTLIPHMAVAVETRSAPVSIAALGPPSPKRTIGLVWRRSNPLGELFASLGAMIAESAMLG